MAKPAKWTDISVSLISIILIIASTAMMFRTGVFSFNIFEAENMTWYLIRSSGITAYLMLAASTIWGLFISSQFVKDWSPGVVSMAMHSTLSWLAIILTGVHAGLLMFDHYFAYTIADILIPFRGPYEPFFVGLGTLSMWMLVIIALSFPLKKRIGHKVWRALHMTSYLTFGFVTIHGLMAGTDGANTGFRVLVGVAVSITVLLLGMRMGKDSAKAAKPTRASKAS